MEPGAAIWASAKTPTKAVITTHRKMLVRTIALKRNGNSLGIARRSRGMRQRIHAAFCRFHTGLLLSELEYGDSIQTISAKTNTLVHVNTVHVSMDTNWPAGRQRAPKMTVKRGGSCCRKTRF